MLDEQYILKIGAMRAHDIQETRPVLIHQRTEQEIHENREQTVKLILGYRKTPSGDITIMNYASREEWLNDPNRVE